MPPVVSRRRVPIGGVITPAPAGSAPGGSEPRVFLALSRPVIVLALAAILGQTHPPIADARSQTDLQSSPPSEKQSRTAAQRKINSRILFEIYRLRGQAIEKNVPPGETGVKIEKERALVDVRADVTSELQKKVVSLGGTIVWTSREYRSIIAWIPLLNLEQLARDPAVRAIEPRAEAIRQSRG
jgi:hypothetical protein